MTNASAFAAEEGLARLLNAAATRYRQLGRIGGTASLEDISAAEARAFHHLRLTGRELPRTGSGVRMDLRRLDEALLAAGSGGLLAVLRVGGDDLQSNAARQRLEEDRAARAWTVLIGSASDRASADWLLSLRTQGKGPPPPSLDTVVAALGLLRANRAEWDRARLASEVSDDPHALDDGTPALTQLLSAFAHQEGTPVPRDAAGRRGLLARHGVVCDPLSSTVLVYGLRATGTGPAARLLNAADGGHVVLTLAQLADSRLHVETDRLFTCENVIVARAAERNGSDGSAVVCSDGQPSTACDFLLTQLARPLRHSGDFDWGGLRIAGLMRRRYGAVPWRHDVATYDAELASLAARPSMLAPPRGKPPEGFASLWARLADRLIPVWQEDLLDALVSDLALTASVDR